MNFLSQIFSERFSSKRYYNELGRSYVEYICGKNEGYTGKICFFHFSHSGKRENSYMDIEILRFIKSYYPQAYGHISAIMKYAISQDVVVTFNSFTEYSFLLKFQSHNKELNTRIENFVKKYTHTKINISDNPNNRFYEIIINIFPSFHIENFRLYSEEKKENFKTIPEYCKHENIFMTLFIQEEIFRNSTVQKNTGVLYKLNQPIVFSDSTFLKKEFGEMLSPYFSLENIYLAFVEKMDNSDNDILYFTDGFFIPA